MKVDKPLKHIKPSPNEEAALLKVAENQRRQQRLIQVRQQEKHSAKLIRRSVQDKRHQELQVATFELQRLAEVHRSEQEKIVQQALDKRLKDIGNGHRNAENIQMPESKFSPKEAKKIAIERQQAALAKLHAEKEKDQHKATSHLNARTNALSMEKERSQFIISQPLPEPTVILNTKALKDSLKFNKVDSYSTSHFHTKAFVQRSDPEKECNAMVAANDETERLELVKYKIDREVNERKEKARLRHIHAKENVLLERDKEFIMKDLAEMEQVDRRRRQKIVAKIPVQIFQPPHIRETTEIDKQKQMENAFETAHRFPLINDDASAFLESMTDESRFETDDNQRDYDSSRIKISLPTTQPLDNTTKEDSIHPDPSLHLSIDDNQNVATQAEDLHIQTSSKAVNLVEKIRRQQEKWKERQKKRFTIQPPADEACTDGDMSESELPHHQAGHNIRSLAQRLSLEDVLTDAANDPDVLDAVKSGNYDNQNNSFDTNEQVDNIFSPMSSVSSITSYSNLSKEEKLAAKKADLLRKYPDKFNKKTQQKSQTVDDNNKGTGKRNPINRFQYFHNELLKQQKWLDERQKVLHERQNNRLKVIKASQNDTTSVDDTASNISTEENSNQINKTSVNKSVISDDSDLDALIQRCLLAIPNASHTESLLSRRKHMFDSPQTDHDTSDVIAEPILKFSRARIPPQSVIDRLRNSHVNSYPAFSPIQEMPEDQYDQIDSPARSVSRDQYTDVSVSDYSLTEQRLSDVVVDSSSSLSPPSTSDLTSNSKQPSLRFDNTAHISTNHEPTTQHHDSSGSTAYLTAEWIDSSASMSRFEELIERVRAMPNIQIEEGKRLISQYQHSMKDALGMQDNDAKTSNNFEHDIISYNNRVEGNDESIYSNQRVHAEYKTNNNDEMVQHSHVSLAESKDDTISTQYVSYFNQIHDRGNESPPSYIESGYNVDSPTLYGSRIRAEGNRSPVSQIHTDESLPLSELPDTEVYINESIDQRPNVKTIRNEENGFLLVMPQPVSFTNSIDEKSDRKEYHNPYWSATTPITNEQSLTPKNEISPSRNTSMDEGMSSSPRSIDISDTATANIHTPTITPLRSEYSYTSSLDDEPIVSLISITRQSKIDNHTDEDTQNVHTINDPKNMTPEVSESQLSSVVDTMSFTAQLTSSISLPISMISSASSLQQTTPQYYPSQPRLDEVDRLDNLSDVLLNISLLSLPETDNKIIDSMNNSYCDPDQINASSSHHKPSDNGAKGVMDNSYCDPSQSNDQTNASSSHHKPSDNGAKGVMDNSYCDPSQSNDQTNASSSHHKPSDNETEGVMDNSYCDPSQTNDGASLSLLSFTEREREVIEGYCDNNNLNTDINEDDDAEDDIPQLETTMSALHDYLPCGPSYPQTDNAESSNENKESISATMVSTYSSPTWSTQLSSFSSGNQDPFSSRSPSTWLMSPYENFTRQSDETETLQNAFEIHKQKLISNSKDRVSNIQSAAEARHTSIRKAHDKRTLRAKNAWRSKSGSSSISTDEASSREPKSTDEKFPLAQRRSKKSIHKTEMRQRTERAYSRLPEVKHSTQEKQKQQQAAINKEKAKEFQRRVREGLRRKQNESKGSQSSTSS